MTVQSALGTHAIAEPRESWVPMIAIALGQMIMSFNVASLPVALSGMVNSFSCPRRRSPPVVVAYLRCLSPVSSCSAPN